MIIKCKKEDLTPVLTAINTIIPSKPSVPIISGCLCLAENNSLIIEGTNLESGIKMQLPAIVEEDGQIVISMKFFNELIKKLPEGELQLTFKEDTQQLSIKSGTSSFNLNCWPATDFPRFNLNSLKENIFKIPVSLWKKSMKKVLFASASPEIRPNFAGVYFSFTQNHIVLAATDTYRLAVLKKEFNINNSLNNILIPVGALHNITRILEDEEEISIFWQNNLISFQTSRFIFASRILDINFPDYRQIIPENFQLRIRFKASEFIAVLERASLFSSNLEQERNLIVNLNIKNETLFVTTDSSSIGSLYEEISLIETSGGECEASFNTRFLLEPLKTMDCEEVILEFNGSEGPAVYREETDSSYLHLILPVRKV